MHVLDQDQVARWVVGLTDGAQADEQTGRFLECSSLAWPCVLAHVRRDLTRQGLNSDEIKSLAIEIWEETLRSVWKTCQLRPKSVARIENLENYLIGSFHHRFNRRLKRKRVRDSMLEFLPPAELADIRGTANVDEDYAVRIHRGIQLERIYAEMNQNVRRAIIARIYGFSWAEIADRLQIEEQNLIMRVQYAIRKVRNRFSRG